MILPEKESVIVASIMIMLATNIIVEVSGFNLGDYNPPKESVVVFPENSDLTAEKNKNEISLSHGRSSRTFYVTLYDSQGNIIDARSVNVPGGETVTYEVAQEPARIMIDTFVRTF